MSLNLFARDALPQVVHPKEEAVDQDRRMQALVKAEVIPQLVALAKVRASWCLVR